MSEIADFERRIMAALERIGAGVDQFAEAQEAGPDTDFAAQLEQLNKALEAERQINAQLQETVDTVQGKQQSQTDELQEKISQLEAKLGEKSGQIEELEQCNQQLQDSQKAGQEAEGKLEEAEKAAAQKLEQVQQEAAQKLEQAEKEAREKLERAEKEAGEKFEQAQQQAQDQLAQAQQEASQQLEQARRDNEALQAELDSLRTTRKADLKELETIMADLKPMLTGGA